MNVFLDTTPLENANSIRGVGVYTRFLYQELKKLQDKKFQVFMNEEKEGLNQEEIDIVHYPFFDLFFDTLPLKLPTKDVQQANLLHSKIPQLFRSQKVVVTIHDVIPLIFPDQYLIGLRGKLRFWKQQVALTQVDAVITDSEASKADIVRLLRVPESKVKVVYLAGNPEIKKASSIKGKEVRKNYNLPEKYVLYVGDINYNKNIPELIRTVPFLDPEIRLVCVGKNFTAQPIPEWEQIQIAITNTQMPDRIHFITDLGSDANETLSALYTEAECYVQPSLYEGFGLPVLEALQCETPVVCAQNSSLIEVGGEVVEFVGTSAQEIADGIKRVLEVGRTEKWRSGVKAHLKQFSWKKTAEETKKIYGMI